MTVVSITVICIWASGRTFLELLQELLWLLLEEVLPSSPPWERLGSADIFICFPSGWLNIFSLSLSAATNITVRKTLEWDLLGLEGLTEIASAYITFCVNLINSQSLFK